MLVLLVSVSLPSNPSVQSEVMEEVVVYKALYNYSPSDDELTEGYIAIKTDDVLEVKKSEHLAAECGGNIQVGCVL